MVLAGFLGYCVQEHGCGQGCKCWLSAEGLHSWAQPCLFSQPGLKACLRSWPNPLVFGQRQCLAQCCQQKEIFQGYCNAHPAAKPNSADGCWGYRHIAASPAILCLHLGQSLLEKGLRVVTADPLAACLWLHGKEDSQQNCSQ